MQYITEPSINTLPCTYAYVKQAREVDNCWCMGVVAQWQSAGVDFARAMGSTSSGTTGLSLVYVNCKGL